MLQAVAWSAETARQAQMPVIVWGQPHQILTLNAARFGQLSVVPEDTDPHHLQIWLLRGTIAQLRDLAALPVALHRVTTADGAVLCTVLPGSEFEELRRRLETVGRPSS